MFERVIIASGTSNRQTKALSASVRDKVRHAGFAKPRIEGEDNGEWIIVDCGPAVVHIMQPTIRTYYNLEEIWGGTPVRLKFGAPKPVGSADVKGHIKSSVAKKATSKTTGTKTSAAKTAVAKPAAKAKPALKAPVKSSQPARKTSAKAPAKTAVKTAAKSASKPTVKTVGKPATKTATKSPAKPAAKKAPARKAVQAATRRKAD